METDTKRFQKRCMLMFGILLFGVVVNFGLNTAATVKRADVREKISREHNRIERKLDVVEKKIDKLLEQKQ